jgi:hypothetical protein
LSGWLADAGYVKGALTVARTIRYREVEARLTALVGVLPHVAHSERIRIIEEVIGQISGVSSSLVRGAAGRRGILEKVVAQWVPLPRESRYDLWCKAIREVSAQNREACLADLRICAPVVVSLGGNVSVEEAVQAIEDVGRWFA